MSGESKGKGDGSLERLRDLRGGKPAPKRKPPKSADPNRRKVDPETAAFQERVRSLILEAMPEYEAVKKEHESKLIDYEWKACWQEYKKGIKRSGMRVPFAEHFENWLGERTAAGTTAHAKKEKADRQWEAALQSNWQFVDEMPERKRREEAAAASADERRAEMEKLRAEMEEEEELRREILAEENLRQANLKRERKKAKVRAKMQRKGEIPPDEVVADEKAEYQQLRQKRKPTKDREHPKE